MFKKWVDHPGRLPTILLSSHSTRRSLHLPVLWRSLCIPRLTQSRIWSNFQKWLLKNLMSFWEARIWFFDLMGRFWRSVYIGWKDIRAVLVGGGIVVVVGATMRLVDVGGVILMDFAIVNESPTAAILVVMMCQSGRPSLLLSLSRETVLVARRIFFGAAAAADCGLR